MLILIMKNITNNTMYIVQELHIFSCSFKVNYKSFYSDLIPSHQYFHYVLQLIHQLTFFYTYHFSNLNILHHHMIFHIHLYNCQDSKQILYHIILCQSILCIHICIYLHSILFIITNTCIQSTFALTGLMSFYVFCFISF